jgi:DNA processing protein
MSKLYATAETGIAPSFAQSLTTIYETWSPLSSIVSIIVSEVGPSARFGAVAPAFFSAGRSPACWGAAMTDLVHYIALSLLPSWSWLPTAERLRAGDPPAAVLDQLLSSHWPDDPNRRSELCSRARAAIDRGQKRRITPVAWSNPLYPVALTTIADPPPVLWMQGSRAAFDRPAVAIVGARAASTYGLSVAERLAADLAARGLAIVSGLARGVDSAAHRGALSAGGVTLGIMGSGVDVMYPSEHSSLARDMQQHGAVVSELVPGTPPLKQFFPMRNRIISGLSRAVVVIEAGEKSGSLITARCALEQGREVLAVPGNVLSGRNRGAHALLKDGAKIVESADDILEELRLPSLASVSACGEPASPGQDPILACLTPGEPNDLDAIAERSGLTTARLLPRLFELELQGAVARVGGGRFVRV